MPFAEKDQAKGLGAIWDRRVQSWYVPPGADNASLTRWSQQRPPEAAEGHELERAAPSTASEQRASNGRQYLSVPYGERAPAKAAGATWDKAAKCWYARSKADMGKLQRWLPKIDSHSREEPALNPREEFGEALRRGKE